MNTDHINKRLILFNHSPRFTWYQTGNEQSGGMCSKCVREVTAGETAAAPVAAAAVAVAASILNAKSPEIAVDYVQEPASAVCVPAAAEEPSAIAGASGGSDAPVKKKSPKKKNRCVVLRSWAHHRRPRPGRRLFFHNHKPSTKPSFGTRTLCTLGSLSPPNRVPPACSNVLYILLCVSCFRPLTRVGLHHSFSLEQVFPERMPSKTSLGGAANGEMPVRPHFLCKAPTR
jgi:hypothetical protein